MNKVIEQLGGIGVVPVIKIDDVSKAVPLARALAAGGIPCAEITFRTAEGVEAIAKVAKEVPEVLVGAGTVLTTEQVDKAIDSGAKFIVSPGFNPKVVAHCIKKGVPITPGCTNPSLMETAIEMGLDVVKFFPAEQSGGLAFIKAVSGPFSKLKFMPTGGISAANIGSYLAFDKIVACGGSWMVPPEMVSAGEFDKITNLCREAVSAVHGFTLMHVGINTANEAEAKKAAQQFDLLFGFAPRETSISWFAGDYVEAMKSQGAGKNGHIGIGVLNVARAQAYLERKGFQFNPDSRRADAKGATTAIYLKDEIAGFAVHIMKKK